MTDLQWLASYFADGTRHFLLSGFMGASAFCSMQIMWCACGWAWERGTRRKIPTAAAYGMMLTAIFFGIACALAGHLLLDKLSIWYTTPLGPPLTIDRGPQG